MRHPDQRLINLSMDLTQLKTNLETLKKLRDMNKLLILFNYSKIKKLQHKTKHLFTYDIINAIGEHDKYRMEHDKENWAGIRKYETLDPFSLDWSNYPHFKTRGGTHLPCLDEEYHINVLYPVLSNNDKAWIKGTLFILFQLLLSFFAIRGLFAFFGV